jgi:uncharacterized protein YkwD
VLRKITALLACALGLAVPASPALAGAESKARRALNEIRRSHGLHELRASESLGRSSSRYAARMIRSDYFGHGPRISVAGRWTTAGETLAWHSGVAARPRRTVRQWMASPPHRAVLLSSRFRFVGMGLARGRLGSEAGTAWVAHVGSH